MHKLIGFIVFLSVSCGPTISISFGANLEPAPKFSSRDAENHFASGVGLYEAKAYQSALSEFIAAFSEESLPIILVNQARCLVKLELYAEAITTYGRYLSREVDPAAEQKKEEVRNLIKVLIERQREKEFEEKLALQAKHAPRPLPPKFFDFAPHKVAVGTASATLASVILVAYFGSQALENRRDYDSSCDTGACNPRSYQVARDNAVATDIALTIGVVGGVATAVLFALKPKLKPEVLGFVWGTANYSAANASAEGN